MNSSEISERHEVAMDFFRFRSLFIHYIFMIQFIVGTIGNLINLLVLLSREMRNHSSFLLACMAMADLAFLVTMLPVNLNTFHNFIIWPESFGTFFQLHLLNHFTGLSNWFAASSHWFVVAVSVERLMAIKWPLHVRYLWTTARLRLTVFAILLATFILTFNFHVQDRMSVIVANETQIVHIKRTTVHPKYSKWSTILQIVLQGIVPVVLLIVLNSALLYVVLKHSRSHGHPSASASTNRCHGANNNAAVNGSKKSTLTVSMHRNGPSTSIRRQSADGPVLRRTNTSARTRQEHKLTLMAVTIVSCVLVTQLPSTVYNVIRLIDYSDWNRRIAFFKIGIVMNSLVVMGKIANFFLFCTSSEHFRRRTYLLLCQNRRRAQQQKRNESLTHAYTISQVVTPRSDDTPRNNVDALEVDMGDHEDHEAITML